MKVDWKLLLIAWFVGLFSADVLLRDAHAAPQGPLTAAVVRDTVKALKDIAANTGQISQTLKRIDARAHKSDQNTSQGDVRPGGREGLRCRMLR